MNMHRSGWEPPGTPVLTAYERKQLSVESFVDERTIRRAYADPHSVREATLRRLMAAAAKLGLTPPGAAS